MNKIDEIKAAIYNCNCDECTLREACDLYEEFTNETICSIAVAVVGGVLSED